MRLWCHNDGYGMSQGRFAVADVRTRLCVDPAHRNPHCCIPAARSTVGTGECKRHQSDGSRRKGFLRNLFDLVTNGDGGVEYYGDGWAIKQETKRFHTTAKLLSTCVVNRRRIKSPSIGQCLTITLQKTENFSFWIANSICHSMR